MTAQATEWTALAARVERLERQNRRLKIGGLGLALAAGTALLMGGQEPASRKAGDPFSFRDGQGKERARIAMGADGPVLQFLDENGTEQANLGTGRAGMLFRVMNNQGRLMTGLSLERTGVAIVTVDESGRVQSGPNALKPDAGLLVPARRP
jgi:hypothetical protein